MIALVHPLLGYQIRMPTCIRTSYHPYRKVSDYMGGNLTYITSSIENRLKNGKVKCITFSTRGKVQ